jgi:Zn-dependent peptidase ImmA (M78 family)/DNA-binding XRE family transcriptional regulator
MIGKRLKKAREAAGLSLRDLEARLNKLVTAQAIGKYERDEMMPSSTVLLAMAKALDVAPEYLMSIQDIELAGVDFRKGAATASKEERAVEAMVLDRVERYLAIEALLPGESQSWDPMGEWTFSIGEVDDAEGAADALRKYWNLGIDPIPEMAELLEEHGIKVVSLELPETISGSKALVRRGTSEDVPVVVVNAKHNGERQRFTLAHELAHLVLRFESELKPAKQEKAADRFAGAFLMAKEMLVSLLGQKRTAVSLGELVGIKQLFKVSVAAIVVRCRQLDIISPIVFKTLWNQVRAMNLNAQGTKEPHAIAPEEPTRMWRLCLRAVAEGIISEAKAASLLRMTVRQLDQKLTAAEPLPA